jgi:hypothetical protein
VDQEALPTLRVSGTARGQVRMLSVAIGGCAAGLWMSRGPDWSVTSAGWGFVVLAAVSIGVFAARMLVPSTLTLDAQGLTWKVVGWPGRRLLWSDIDRFGVVAARPPLIDELIGYSFRPGRAPNPAQRPSWTGFDATIGSGWKIEPKSLVETLEKYLQASRANEGATGAV